MIRSKQDPVSQDPELEALLSLSDEELLREAAAEGQDVPSLVSAMRQRIAGKLREAAQGSPPVTDEAPASGAWGTRPDTTARLDPDIACLDLAAVSYLAILQYRWSDPVTAAAEQDYRRWLQCVRNGWGETTVISGNVHDYFRCHLQHATSFLSQTTALFGRPLLRRPAIQVRVPGRALERPPPLHPAVLPMDSPDRYQSAEVSEEGVVEDLATLIGAKESPDHALETLEILRELCVGDSAAQSLLRAAQQGLSPPEARTFSGLKPQAYSQAIQRLGRLMRKHLPQEMHTLHVRVDRQTQTVDVDDAYEAIERSLPSPERICPRCNLPFARRILGIHTVPIQGEPAVQRILVHKVEMTRCMTCDASQPTLDGRIRIERATHRAILFLQAWLGPH